MSASVGRSPPSAIPEVTHSIRTAVSRRIYPRSERSGIWSQLREVSNSNSSLIPRAELDLELSPYSKNRTAANLRRALLDEADPRNVGVGVNLRRRTYIHGTTCGSQHDAVQASRQTLKRKS